MMKNKKQIALIAGLAAVLLCTAILLFSCNGHQGDDTPSTSDPVQTTGGTTAPATEATTEPTEAVTTAPTEETTVPTTEEITEPTEETTEPTEPEDQPSGGGRPGGTGGFEGGTLPEIPDEDPTEPTEEILEVPEPGTEGNAYVETLAELPDSFKTVKVPAKGSIYYWLNNAQGAQLTIADADAYVILDGKTYKSQDGAVSLVIPAGEKTPLKLQVGNASGSAKAFSLSFTIPEGTQGNPYVILDVTQPIQLHAKPGEVLYYSGNLAGYVMTIPNAQDLVLTVNGETVQPDANGTVQVQFPAADGRPEPVILGIGTTAAQEKDYTAVCVRPLGSLENPAPLQMGENSATIAANNADGYNYVATATDEGTLVITMSGTNWQYMANNLTAGIYGDLCDASQDPSTAVLELKVQPGDEITLMVNGFNPEDVWSYPGGTVNFTVEFVDKTGTQDNPIPVYGQFPIVTPEIPAGQTLYYSVTGCDGMVIDTDAAITVDGKAYTGESLSTMRGQALLIAVTNTAEEAKSYTLNFRYPLGHPENPAQLQLGENTAVIQPENELGYLLTWTASNNGTLTITMDGSNWQYVMNNDTAGVYGDLLDASDPANGVLEVKVNEGDQLSFTVNGFNPEDVWSYPGGTVTFTAEFLAGSGTEENPHVIYNAFPIITPEMDFGKSLYYKVYGAGGKIMTVQNAADLAVTYNGKVYTADENGVLTVAFLATDAFQRDINFILTSGAEDPTSYTLNFAFPVGHPENPDKLTIGNNSAALAANNADGYRYTWTADADGKLIITMTGDSWQYTVNNETKGQYGASHLSDEDPKVSSETVEVTEGDVVTVTVNTYTAGVWDTPAGTVEFTAEFAPAQGATPENPLLLVPQKAEMATLKPGAAVYYQGRLQDTVLVIENAQDAVVIMGDQEYKPNSSGVIKVTFPAASGRPQPIPFSLTSNAAETKTYVLLADYPKGHTMNPAAMELGENTASLKAKQTEGYHFHWTATGDGLLTVVMTDEEGWCYSIDNQVVYSETYTYADETPVTAYTLAVKEGELIHLIVGTFDPESNTPPAGKIHFTAFLATGEGTAESPAEIRGQAVIATPELEPGQTVHYKIGGIGGMILNVQGTDAAVTVGGNAYGGSVIDANPRASVAVAVTNDGSSARRYILTFTYPVGSFMNPATLAMGENVATLEAGNTDGYNYTWTADKDGTLTITMGQGDWQYVMNNTGSGIYGNNHTSDEEPVVSTESIAVKAGDEVTVSVNTYTPGEYDTPAGTVSFTASFAEPEPEVSSETEPVDTTESTESTEAADPTQTEPQA